GAQSGHDLATVGVAGDNGRAVLAGQHLAQSSDVSGKLGDRKLGCGDSVAVGLQALDDGAPTGAVGPGTMHQHNIRERIHFFTSFRSFYEHCFPKMEAPIFTFSEQKRCSSFREVPALHVTTFLSHVLALQPHQDSGNSFTLQCLVRSSYRSLWENQVLDRSSWLRGQLQGTCEA